MRVLLWLQDEFGNLIQPKGRKKRRKGGGGVAGAAAGLSTEGGRCGRFGGRQQRSMGLSTFMAPGHQSNGHNLHSHVCDGGSDRGIALSLISGCQKCLWQHTPLPSPVPMRFSL